MSAPDGGRSPADALRRVLSSMGVPTAEIDRAEDDGTLVLLGVEHLVLPEQARYDIAELAARTTLPVEQISQLWRALGFADPSPGEVIFSDDDVAMLDALAEVIGTGVVEPDLVVQMTRVIGSSVARIALAQIESFSLDDEVEARVEERSGPDGPLDDAAFLAQTTAGLALMPKAMEYVWRRHVQAAARSRVLQAEEGSAVAGGRVQSVGFADLVGFTALSQQIDSHELADVVDRFETLAHDTVTRLGGRVVKMIGDEAMFVVPDPARAAEIALSLAEAYRDDDELSDVRVGLAHGPVLEREADCYGPVVNLASRLVGIAFPGTVVVSEAVHDALAEDPAFAWRPLRRRHLKDIGRVALWTIRRAGEPDAPRSAPEEARAERAERVERAVARRYATDDDF